MALIVEDGTGIVTADSWLTLADYDAIILSTFDETRTATDAATEAAIRRGVGYIGTLDIEGSRTYGRAQGTCLPRSGMDDGDGIAIDSAEIPVEFKKALAYLARAEVNSPGALSPTVKPAEGSAQIKRVKEAVGPLVEETEYAVSSSLSTADNNKSSVELAIEQSRAIVTSATDILKPFLRSGVAGGYEPGIFVV